MFPRLAIGVTYTENTPWTRKERTPAQKPDDRIAQKSIWFDVIDIEKADTTKRIPKLGEL